MEKWKEPLCSVPPPYIIHHCVKLVFPTIKQWTNTTAYLQRMLRVTELDDPANRMRRSALCDAALQDHPIISSFTPIGSTNEDIRDLLDRLPRLLSLARCRVLETEQQLSAYHDVHVSILTPQKPSCHASQLCDCTITDPWVSSYTSLEAAFRCVQQRISRSICELTNIACEMHNIPHSGFQ